MLKKTGLMRMMMTMNGKMSSVMTSFQSLFNAQRHTQQILLAAGKYEDYCEGSTDMALPEDSVSLSSYHVQQLVSEIGEILDADKRWKNFRNEKYDKAAKAEEIADCFIVLMNIAMFSGISGDDMASAISMKLYTVRNRVEEACKNAEDSDS